MSLSSYRAHEWLQLGSTKPRPMQFPNLGPQPTLGTCSFHSEWMCAAPRWRPWWPSWKSEVRQSQPEGANQTPAGFALEYMTQNMRPGPVFPVMNFPETKKVGRRFMTSQRSLIPPTPVATTSLLVLSTLFFPNIWKVQQSCKKC